MNELRLAVLGSTRGTGLIPLAELLRDSQASMKICLCLSDKRCALVLQRAQEMGIKSLFLKTQGLDRESYDRLLHEELCKHRIDCVLLIGFMRILSEWFVEQWQGRILNVHPSLLPDFSGMMDLSVHEAVLASQKTTSGCTVHVVTKDLDAGPILAQKSCAVFAHDTPQSLKSRVQALEAPAFLDALNTFLRGDHAHP